MPPRYKSLIVAPRIDAPYSPLPNADKEVGAVVSNLNGDQELLNGNVTEEMVLVALEKERDLVWFVTHSDERGILLSNGKYLSPGRLIQATRGAKVKLIVLNTCSSVGAAFKIHNELRTFLICTLGETPDDAAYATGRRLARALGRGLSFLAAFNEAIPGMNDNWLFFPGQEEEETMPPPRRQTHQYGGATGTTIDSQTAINDLRELVQEFEKVLYGDERLQVPGLAPSVKNITERMSKLEADMKFVRILVWIIFATVMLLAVVTMIWFVTQAAPGAVS